MDQATPVGESLAITTSFTNPGILDTAEIDSADGTVEAGGSGTVLAQK